MIEIMKSTRWMTFLNFSRRHSRFVNLLNRYMNSKFCSLLRMSLFCCLHHESLYVVKTAIELNDNAERLSFDWVRRVETMQYHWVVDRFSFNTIDDRYSDKSQKRCVWKIYCCERLIWRFASVLMKRINNYISNIWMKSTVISCCCFLTCKISLSLL